MSLPWPNQQHMWKQSTAHVKTINKTKQSKAWPKFLNKHNIYSYRVSANWMWYIELIVARCPRDIELYKAIIGYLWYGTQVSSWFHLGALFFYSVAESSLKLILFSNFTSRCISECITFLCGLLSMAVTEIIAKIWLYCVSGYQRIHLLRNDHHWCRGTGFMGGLSATFQCLKKCLDINLYS